MPRYVYQNLETGEQYEFEQGFHDPAYTHHPETGAPIKRLIFAPAVVFKGSGWYVNDSKSHNKTNPSPKAESKSEGSQNVGGAAAD
jgi:predicted nucleic acid-binding Zn ribbon protein